MPVHAAPPVLTRTELARAFATHRFAEVYDRLDPDLRWIVDGRPALDRDATVVACESLLGDLAHTVAELLRVEVVEDGASVTVETVTRYVDLTGTTVVASQDTLDFEGATVVAITSYVAEAADPADPVSPAEPAAS
ncbi:hypothetical protein GCM10023340_45470 [Nocardioides marinquilinus]|uniref:SnoaL-like domain-containing protein n=1 Tax=Nocardioides marinquilinus TaxID=1210400 RepID=A0ABP9Q4G6_9ACTN